MTIPASLRRTLLLAATAALACSGTPADPVEQLQIELESAAEARDAERFAERLSESFRGPRGLTRTEARGTLRRYFAAYESVSLEVYGVEVERETDRARVRCVVEFAGRARQLGGLRGLLPPAAVYRFDLTVADEAGVWRVREASWERVQPDEVGRALEDASWRGFA
jgi:hypothetical protein